MFQICLVCVIGDLGFPLFMGCFDLSYRAGVFFL